MSTGQQHHNENNAITFEAINAHVSRFSLDEIDAPTAPAAVAQSAADRAQRLLTTYTAARPILVAVAAIPFIPANWRAIVGVLVATLDQITASFKAGKDLSIGDEGPVSTMEPKLPA